VKGWQGEAQQMTKRAIDVDIDVFARLWRLRRQSEQSENDILRRILNEYEEQARPEESERNSHAMEEAKTSDLESSTSSLTRRGAEDEEETNAMPELGKIRWVDDVVTALRKLGGEASLHQIYQTVERLRKSAGRSCPKTLEATVRRTLENHSSDSGNWLERADIFQMPYGKHKGVWALRK
jgi:hypothetical protein